MSKQVERASEKMSQPASEKRSDEFPSLEITIKDDKTIVGVKLNEMHVFDKSIGSACEVFTDHALGYCRNLSTYNSTPENQALETKAAIAIVQGIRPRDQIEGMLALQMTAIHNATLDAALKLKNAQEMKQRDSAEKTLNKLTRTFTTQMEALRKYRTGGQQKVTVEHVNVHEGGQAIVGMVNHNSNNRVGGDGK